MKTKNSKIPRDWYSEAMSIRSQKKADIFWEELIAYSMKNSTKPREEIERIQRANLGYVAGYYDHKVRERVERLFRCAHPVFGKIKENGPPSQKEAFKRGKEIGAKMRQKHVSHD